MEQLTISDSPGQENNGSDPTSLFPKDAEAADQKTDVQRKDSEEESLSQEQIMRLAEALGSFNLHRSNARGKVYRTLLYVDHMSNDLKESTVFTLDNTLKYASTYSTAENDVKRPVRAMIDAVDDKTLDEALIAFCQPVILSKLVPSQVFYLAAATVQRMFDSFDGRTFDRTTLPYGIQGLQKRFCNFHISGTNSGDHVSEQHGDTIVESDTTNPALTERGLVKFVFRRANRDTEWLCFVQEDHADFRAHFQSVYWTFQELLALSLEIFDNAESFCAIRKGRPESETLVETINRGKYLSMTRVVQKNEYLPFFLPVGTSDVTESDGRPKEGDAQFSIILDWTQTQQAVAAQDSSLFISGHDSCSTTVHQKKRQTTGDLDTTHLKKSVSMESISTLPTVLEEIEEEIDSTSLPAATMRDETASDVSAKTMRNRLRNIAKRQRHKANKREKTAENISAEVAGESSLSSIPGTKSSKQGPEAEKPSKAIGPAEHDTQKSPDQALAAKERIVRFDSYEKFLTCKKAGCGRLTNCWDGSTVICPACGPRSVIRYCRAQHLYDDLHFHWAEDCGRCTVTTQIDENTIHPRQVDLLPFIVSPRWDCVERFRQAVYHSANRSADYFIFFDIDEIEGGLDATPTPEEYMLVRGHGKFGATVSFFDDGTEGSEKRRFHGLLEQCLANALGREDLVFVLVMMIRENLMAIGRWTSDMVTYLCMQIGYEFRYAVPACLQAPFYEG